MSRTLDAVRTQAAKAVAAGQCDTRQAIVAVNAHRVALEGKSQAQWRSDLEAAAVYAAMILANVEADAGDLEAIGLWPAAWCDGEDGEGAA